MLGVESQPDTIAVPLTISRSPPFRRLLSRIGHSTYRLNTILVGLEQIAAGAGKIGAVAVTWTKPKSLKGAKQTADQARIFACAGALVLANDVFDSFLREFALEEWLGFEVSTRDIATKAKTRSKEIGGAYSVAERAKAFCAELCLDDDVSVAALDLLANWRNVVVHSAERSIRLGPGNRNILAEASSKIHDEYSHLDIALALKNFEGREVPLAKEVTSLVAIAVNFSRQLDEAAIRRVASTSEEMLATAEKMLRAYFDTSRERSITPWSELSDAWQGGNTRRRNMLKKFLASAGITENKAPISVPLPESFIEETIAIGRDEFAYRYGISKD